jgi:hypothetical protein
MTEGVQSVRRAVPGKLAQRQKYREWFVKGLLILLFFVVLALVALILRMENQASQQSDTIYRSEAELINGGKRFIDAFYSLNAATINHDQFKAISMMATLELRKERLKYLTRTDLVRQVRNQNVASVVRWDRSSAELVGKEKGVARVEYAAQLIINQEKSYPLNIVLELVPVEKSDDNTDGVGVLSWTDVADNPFIEGSER